MLQITSVNKTDKPHKYNVIIGTISYIFDEEIIIEYNLYSGKEIDDDILDKALAENDIQDYYDKALKYSLKYAKTAGETLSYLMDNKGLDYASSIKIIDKLKSRKLLNDEALINQVIYSLIIGSNGKLMIREKLKAKKFDSKLIDEALKNIDYDLYYEALAKLYKKIEHKYDKDSDYIRINKIRNYLYRHGYTQDDIRDLNIK